MPEALAGAISAPKMQPSHYSAPVFLAVLLVWSPSVASSSSAATCLNGSNPHFTCPAPCFCNAASSPRQIDVQYNLTFSEKYALELDIYQPANDSRHARPAVIAIHGGGFSGGGRGSEGHRCEGLATRGYVCATISYRLHPGINPGKDWKMYDEVVLNATYDARAAIRWLRANAGRYKIDTSRIGATGSSAGALTVAFLVTVPGEGDSGNPGFDSSIAAGVSLSGALLATRYLQIKASQPPFLDLHGCLDQIVPYIGSTSSPLSLAYNGVSTHEQMVRHGASASLISFTGCGHIGTPAENAAVAAHEDEIYSWFAQHLNLSTAECLPGLP